MIPMDDETAQAINAISSKMSKEWAQVEHFMALTLVNARDRMENGVRSERDERAGECAGIRQLWQMRRRAVAVKTGKPQSHDREIVGEAAYLAHDSIKDELS